MNLDNELSTPMTQNYSKPIHHTAARKLKHDIETLSVDNKLERGHINDLGHSKRFTKAYRSNDGPILEKEPETILSAMKLLEQAQVANNQQLSKHISTHIHNNYVIGTSGFDNVRNPDRSPPGVDFNRASFGRSTYDSGLFKSNQTQNYSRTNQELVDIISPDDRPMRSPPNMFQHFTVPNYAENKRQVDTIGVNVRHNIKPVPTHYSIPINALNYDERPLNKIENPLASSVDYASSDERPIRPNPNIGYNMAASTPEVQKIQYNEQKPVFIQHTKMSPVKESKMSPNKADFKIPKEISIGNKNVNPKKFLKRRSKLGYDPIKAVQDEKEKSFNDTQSVTSISKLSYVQARTDSNLRPDPQARKDFRKTKNSNSEILKQRKSICSTVPVVTEDISKDVNKVAYCSVTKIPKLSNSRFRNNLQGSIELNDKSEGGLLNMRFGLFDNLI